MASSPPTPLHTSLSNPKKRPSIGLHALTTQPDSKRQKVLPHPLRQSSYPDPAAPGFYISRTPNSARSETGSVANSLVSGSVVSATKSKRPRGRPRKSAQPNDEDVEATQNTESASLRATAADGRSQVSARSGAHNDEADDGDDDDDDLVDALPLNEQEKVRRKEQDNRDHARTRRLYEALTKEQQDRFDIFTRSKFSKNALRKIVNQTVSQSVTANPLLAIGLYSKHFAGEIIVKACDVQKEWAKARDIAMQEEKQARDSTRQAMEYRIAELRKQNMSHNAPKDDGTPPIDYRANAMEINNLSTELHRLREEEKRTPPIANEHRGSLLPQHLREALRRYKADGEGGGVGFAGMSNHLIGVPGSATWRVGQGLGGRRLFR